uniref:Uncharacterized protein n=1 Tax=Setaria italica TaxID=4555 RepID=K3YF84_SETIT
MVTNYFIDLPGPLKSYTQIQPLRHTIYTNALILVI